MNNEKELRVALERLLQERDTKVADLAQLDSAIEGIRKILGESGTHVESHGSDTSVLSLHSRETGRQPRQAYIRPDQFFGLSHTAATESYLRMIGHAAHLDQILEALNRGGVTIGGADPKKNLYIELIKATKKFVLVSAYTFGHREFYPNLPKKTRKEAPKRGQSRRRGKTKPRAAHSRKKVLPKSEHDETLARE